MLNIDRKFVHKRFGEIGAVKLEVPEGDWKLDGNKLPESSVLYLATFSLQSLQDAYAGCENAEDAKADWGTKLDRLIEGTIGVRSGVGDKHRIMRQLVISQLKEKQPKEYEKLKGLAAAQLNAQIDKIIDNQSDTQKAALESAADDKIKLLIKQQEEKAKLMEGLDIDLDV